MLVLLVIVKIVSIMLMLVAVESLVAGAKTAMQILLMVANLS